MDILGGPGSIAAWDQTQHEAIVRLRNRKCRGFVLVTYEGDEGPTMVAASRDMSVSGFALLLALTAKQALEDAEKLADVADDEDRAA